MINWIKNLHPARIGGFFEALIAAVAAFLPLSGEQVAALMAIVLLLQVSRSGAKSSIRSKQQNKRPLGAS